MKKRNMMKNIAVTTALAMAASLTACANTEEAAGLQAEALAEAAGSILLSVNPEIKVDYDDEGKVILVEGQNEDGKKVVASCDELDDRECDDVMSDLVEEIYEAGYFDNTIAGNEKNLIIRLEAGSTCPSETFLDDIAKAVQNSVTACGGTSKAMVVDEDDYDDAGMINQEMAEELLLTQLGMNAANVSFSVEELDLDDGMYELEFELDGVTYEYEVNGTTGKIFEVDDDDDDDKDDEKDDFDDDADDDDKDDTDDDDDKDDADDDADDDDKDDADDDDKDDADDDDDDDKKTSVKKPATVQKNDDDDKKAPVKKPATVQKDDDDDDDKKPASKPAPSQNNDDDDDNDNDDDDDDDNDD